MIDPGRNHLFDAVYVRGPMALRALRNVIGDQEILQVGQGLGSRSWKSHPRGMDGGGAGAHHSRSWTVLPGMVSPNSSGSYRGQRLPIMKISARVGRAGIFITYCGKWTSADG